MKAHPKKTKTEVFQTPKEHRLQKLKYQKESQLTKHHKA